MEKKRKADLIQEGVKRRYVQAVSGPEDVLDCGVHSGWKFADVYMAHDSYVQWVLGFGHVQMWKLKCFWIWNGP